MRARVQDLRLLPARSHPSQGRDPDLQVHHSRSPKRRIAALFEGMIPKVSQRDVSTYISLPELSHMATHSCKYNRPGNVFLFWEATCPTKTYSNEEGARGWVMSGNCSWSQIISFFFKWTCNIALVSGGQHHDSVFVYCETITRMPR